MKKIENIYAKLYRQINEAAGSDAYKKVQSFEKQIGRSAYVYVFGDKFTIQTGMNLGVTHSTDNIQDTEKNLAVYEEFLKDGKNAIAYAKANEKALADAYKEFENIAFKK